MADNLRKFTTQEVLNKVYTDSSGITIGLNSQSSKETLNAVLDSSNNRLQVAMAGGTISGDVTISGDLTVEGSSSNGVYDEIIQGGLHIETGDSGGSASADADDLVIEGAANVGITISSPVNNFGNIFFGDSGSTAAGFVRYGHGTNGDALTFGTGGGITRMTITSTGSVQITQTAVSADSGTNAHIKLIGAQAYNHASNFVTIAGKTIYNSSGGTARHTILRAGKENTSDNNYAMFTAFYSRPSNAHAAERMRIDSAGNVGIGTTSPSDYNAVAIKLVVADSGNSGITIASGTGSYGALYFADGTSGTAEYMGALEYNHSSNALKIWANADTDQLVLNSNGKVGIGTDSPGSTTILHLKNTSGDNRAIMVENTVASSYSELQLKAAKEFRIGTGGSGVDVANQFYIYDAGASAHRFDIDTNGNIGIGTKTPSTLVEIQGGLTTVGAVLTLSTKELTVDANDVLGKINFQAPLESSGTDAILPGASIHALATDTFAAANNETALIFSTASSDAEKGSATGGAVFERMRITSTGAISASPNADQTFEFGRTKITAKDSDYMYISHYDMSTGSNWAIRQNSSGGTQVNSASGQALNLSINNTAILGIASTGATVTGNLSIESNSFLKFGTDNSRITGDNNALFFQTAAATRLKLDDNSRISLSNNDGNTSNTVFGKDAFQKIVSGVGTILTDVGADYNSFFGEGVAGTGTTTTATGNVGMGWVALQDLTSGSDNVVLGAAAGHEITTGNENIIIGSNAGGTMTTQDEMVLIGHNSGDAINNDTADGTVAIGHSALTSLTSGAGNTAIGYKAAWKATTASSSTAVGDSALGGAAASALTGANNTAIGRYALADAFDNATNNTAVGNQCLEEITNGKYNTAIGAYAGDVLTTGENNTYLGYYALAESATEKYAVRIGMNGIKKFKTARITLSEFSSGNNTAGKSAHTNALFTIPSKSFISKVVVKVVTLSGNSDHLMKVVFSSTLNHAVGIAVNSPTTVIAASSVSTGYKTRSSVAPAADSSIQLGTTGGTAAVGDTYISQDEDLTDNSTAWATADVGFYIAHAGSNTNSASDPDPVIDLLVEYY